MQPGQKHLVKCRCVLSQFKNLQNPPEHQFVVFSAIDDDGNVIPKPAQCNNCGIVHKVIDICKSEVLHGKEHTGALLTIDDIRPSLHQNLITILDKNSADLPTWEACQYAVENNLWGSVITLTSDSEEDGKAGKYVRILGESLFKVESYTRTEVV